MEKTNKLSLAAVTHALTAAAYTKGSTDRFCYSAACGRAEGGSYRASTLRGFDGRKGWRQGPGTVSTKLGRRVRSLAGYAASATKGARDFFDVPAHQVGAEEYHFCVDWATKRGR